MGSEMCIRDRLLRGQMSFESTKEKIVIYGVTDAFGLVVASLQRVRSTYEKLPIYSEFREEFNIDEYESHEKCLGS